jgi:winged helix DNA-binding protein
VLETPGWMRSVGGTGPYLGLFARAGLSRERIDAAMAALEIHELPSARGCTYVVGGSDFAIALRAGQGRSDAADVQTAKKYLGVTDQEIEKLCRAILDALARRPADPRDLKESLGAAVRHLGDEGKKRGMITTLPLGLGLLQAQGEIRRVPVNGRLDQQRYQYARWSPSPLRWAKLDGAEVARELATRFFRWAAPATVAQLAWWAGLGAKAAKAAAAELKLARLGGDDERLLFAEDLDALRAFRVSREARIHLVGSLDNLFHLRREVATTVDPADAERRVADGKKMERINSLSDLPHHAITDRGRLLGFWDYDFDTRKIAWSSFGKATRDLSAAVARMEKFVRDDLGDARSFSLDSPESRKPRIAALAKESKGR